MAETTHEQEHLLAFRAAKDEFMRTDPQSPLGHEQQHSFERLQYFAHNSQLVLALPLDEQVSAEPVVMQTSTGGDQTYRRAGKIHFEVDGQPAELTVYRAEHGDLFLPLRDATSGKETYGAGRYLEPEMTDDSRVRVDFNYLYNPYCAYNEMYACPLPPVENWLKVPIRAGEKKFHE